MRTLFLASTIFVLGLSSTANAHFELVQPPESKAKDTSGKGPPPCGPDTAASATPTAVMGGHTIKIEVNETTYHPGWYRIALAKSRAELPADPKVYDAKMNVLDPAKAGVNSVTGEIQPSVFPILAGNAFDDHTSTGHFMMDLMIPNFDCPTCVLQVEQMMEQHPSNVGIGGFFYHHCADLKITADPALPAFVAPGADGGAPDAGGAKDASVDTGSTGAAGTTGAAGSGAAGNGAAGTSGAAGIGAAGTSGAAGSTTGAAGTSGAAGVGAAGMATGAAGVSGAAGTSGAAGRGGGGSGGGGCSVAGATNAQVGLALVLLGVLAAVQRRRATRRR